MVFQVQYYRNGITQYDEVVTIDEAVYRAKKYSKKYEDRAWVYAVEPGKKGAVSFRGSARLGYWSWAKGSCHHCKGTGVDGALPCPKCEGGSWRP